MDKPVWITHPMPKHRCASYLNLPITPVNFRACRDQRVGRRIDRAAPTLMTRTYNPCNGSTMKPEPLNNTRIILILDDTKVTTSIELI